MSRTKTFLFLILTALLPFGCAHTELQNVHLDESWQAPKLTEYKAAVKRKTQRKQKYNGFYNLFDLSLTFLSENILIKQLKLKALYGQWSPEKANLRLQNLEESLNHEAKFFISVFTPKPDDNKLDLQSSGWGATLYFDGEHFKGKISPISQNANALKTYYPHHNIWSKGFILTFPVPTKELVGKPFQVKFSNPYGQAVYDY